MKNIALYVASFIFGLVAVAHLLRLIYATEVNVGGIILPLESSMIGLGVAIFLSLWMFVAARR